MGGGGEVRVCGWGSIVFMTIPFQQLEMDPIVAQARHWNEKSSSGIEVSRVDEEERQITFRTAHTSFYVTVPQRLGDEEWVSLFIQLGNLKTKCLY